MLSSIIWQKCRS